MFFLSHKNILQGVFVILDRANVRGGSKRAMVAEAICKESPFKQCMMAPSHMTRAFLP